MRAIEPDLTGTVLRRGRRLAYEVTGHGDPAVFLTPLWSILPARAWKAQVPFLARHHRVITADPLGNGGSDRSTDPADYTHEALVEDMLAVLDATGTARAVLVGHCSQALRCLMLAVTHPDRVLGVVALDPNAPALAPPLPARAVYALDAVPDTDEGWAKDTWHHRRRDYRGYLEFFFGELLVEPHSGKVWEDAVAWGLQTTPAVLEATERAPDEPRSLAETEALLGKVTCPVLVINAMADRCIPPERGRRVAELTGAEYLPLDGAGHLLMARQPVVVNREIAGFAARFAPAPPLRRWRRPLDRPRTALMLCSPIGLGHVRRDLAVAAALREQRPGLRIDWLAQSPVAEVVAARGERVHPASRFLAGESAHIEAAQGGDGAGEHDLRVFEAVRGMDEILLANYMLFDEVTRDEPYDLVIADEGWEIDHFLHENPERKRSAYAWLTDFVGWMPMPAGGDREVGLAADLNAQMLEQVARLPRVRDRAVFVGDPDDIVPATFGPGLPSIREWTRERYAFPGYVTDGPPHGWKDEGADRRALGYRDDERICLVTVGGSAVGRHLLGRVVAAFPEMARRVPGLRMIAVTGPRIDPATVPAPPGVDVRGFVPDLDRHLAACDIAVVQGGLATTMELTAARRPFVYVPIGEHFEQNIHVRHRLERHRAGRCLPYADCDPEHLAAAVAEEIDRELDYLPVPTDGAAKTAALLAALI